MNFACCRICCGFALLTNFIVSGCVFLIGYLENTRSVFIQEHRESLSPIGAFFIKGYALSIVIPAIFLMVYIYIVRKSRVEIIVSFSFVAMGGALMELAWVILYLFVTYQRFYI